MADTWGIQTDALIRWYQRQKFRDRVLTADGRLQDWSRVRVRLNQIIADGPNGILASKLSDELQQLSRRYGK